MGIPKSNVLVEHEAKGNAVNAGELLVNSADIITEAPDELVLPSLTVYNNYLAVLLIPIKSEILVVGADNLNKVGIIVGIGSQCVNKFTLGDGVFAPLTSYHKYEYPLPDEYKANKKFRDKDSDYLKVLLIPESSVYLKCDPPIKVTVK